MVSFFFFQWPPENSIYDDPSLTTLQGKQPREIIISGKKAKKSAMGRRVPK